MQLEWLDTFLDLLQTKNFNRTAERLRITQSTVSARVRALEGAIGTNLFIRGRGGAELTPEGSRFESYALNLRLCWNLARQDLAMPQGYENRLRIATQVSLWELLITKWVLWLREALPNTAVHVEADYSKSMIDELIFGNLDVGVIYTPQYRPELENQHLFDEAFTMISTEPVTVERLRLENYVFLALSPHFIAQHALLLPTLHTAPLSVGLGTVAIEYLRARGGAAYMPSTLADKLVADGEFFAVDGAPPIHQPVFVSFLGKNRHRPHVSKAIKALRLIAVE